MFDDRCDVVATVCLLASDRRFALVRSERDGTNGNLGSILAWLGHSVHLYLATKSFRAVRAAAGLAKSDRQECSGPYDAHAIVLQAGAPSDLYWIFHCLLGDT